MSDAWSTAEDQKLLRMWCASEPPHTIREIADDLERSKSSVDRRITALGLRGHKGDRAHYERETGVALDPAIRPVRIDLPATPRAQPSRAGEVTLVWSDVHFPFEDSLALDVLRQVARDLQPDRLVCLGDIFDFFELSDHRAPRDIEPDMQTTIEAGVQHLADMRALSGAREAVFLGGNHEDRWDRMLEQARRDVRFRSLLQLPKVKRALDFEEVVGFEDLGYTYTPYTEGRPHIENDTLLYTHGSFTNKYVARSTMEKYGKSVIFGHMHRVQNFTKRDLKGQEGGWCIGCLCTLDPHYEPFADWHHGFAVVNWHDDLFNVEQVRIHNGVAIFRDTVYTAAP